VILYVSELFSWQMANIDFHRQGPCEHVCLLVNVGNVGGRRSVRLWSHVPATSDQVGSSDEEGCWISGAVHGERTRTPAEA